jgi:hypothetical protein
VNPVWTLEAGQRVALKVGQVLAPGAALTVGNSTLVIAASRSATEITSPPHPTRGRSSSTRPGCWR